jgi:hypothetical protein
LLQLNSCAGFTVACKTGFSVARDRGDNSSPAIDSADGMIACVCDEEVALIVNANLMRPIEFGFQGRSSVAAVTEQAITGNAAQLAPVRRSAIDAMIVDGCDPNLIPGEFDPKWIADGKSIGDAGWLSGLIGG